MFLSIIIPVYNKEKYLSDCLNSCLNQDLSHNEYEIICVNDGSTDGSSEILSEYSKKYDNIIVIDQENAGLSAARNTGIDAARGEYIWFVDSDDFVRENYLGKFRKVLSGTSIDRLIFGYYEFEEGSFSAEQLQEKVDTLQMDTSLSALVVWSSLYRRSFLDDSELRFHKDIRYYAEDAIFHIEFNHLKPSVLTFDEVCYFYRRNNISITRTKTKEAKRIWAESSYKLAHIMLEYAVKDRQELADNHANAEKTAGVLMPAVRQITCLAVKLPAQMRKDVLDILKANDLFPLFLYRKPRDWFPKKIHMSHAVNGFPGKVLDVLNFYSTTHLGFTMLLLVQKLIDKRNNK